MKATWTWILMLGWLAWFSLGAGAENGTFALGDVPLLLVDDSGIESKSGVTRTIHVARSLDAPVMEPDRPWEAQRLYIYGSVHPDPATGGLRMWYMALDKAGSGTRMLYATSADGLSWTKPSLGLVDYPRAKENNIITNANSPSVILDAFEKDPAKRFKMIRIVAKRQYAAAYSADGLHWTDYPINPILSGGDTATLSQDARTGEYLLFSKHDRTVRGRTRRVVSVSRSSDFQKWTKPKLTLSPDEEDDAWARRPDEHAQFYVMSVYPHAAGFIGLPTVFHVMSIGKRGAGQSGQDGPLDIQLVSSLDGATWQRTQPRINVIPRGAPGTYNGGGILGVSSTPAHLGDKTYVFYTAMNTGHGGAYAAKRFTIGRAQWRLHGFASLDADSAGGRVETKPFRLVGPSLIVNADAGRGQLRVALLEADGKPILGYTAEDSEVLSADATRWTARWRTKATVLTDRPVRVMIEMKNARLFSPTSGREQPDRDVTQ